MYEGPGQYRHYKGGVYEVLGLALQENTVLKPTEPTPQTVRPREIQFVVYRPLSPGSLLEQREEEFWARERSDFDDTVEPVSGTRCPRFLKLPAKKLDIVSAPVVFTETATVDNCIRCGEPIQPGQAFVNTKGVRHLGCR